MPYIYGLDIRAERVAQRDTDTIQLSLSAAYCGMCGLRLDKNGKCPVGCGDTSHNTLLGAFYAERLAQECPGCGAEIRPDHTRMAGNWWTNPAQTWTFHCDQCGNGTLAELALARLQIESMDSEHILHGQA